MFAAVVLKVKRGFQVLTGLLCLNLFWFKQLQLDEASVALSVFLLLNRMQRCPSILVIPNLNTLPR